MILVTPKAGAEHELLLNIPVSGQFNQETDFNLAYFNTKRVC